MRAAPAATVTVVLSVCAALAGCSTLLGIDDLVADRVEGVGAAGAGGGSSGGGGGASGGTGGTCAGPCGTPGCAECPPSNVVVVTTPGGTFAIDRYEVSNAEYQAFLASSPSLSLAPQPVCSWNDSFVPGAVTQAALDEAAAAGIPVEDPTPDCIEWARLWGASDRPVACVDWCDAAGYCAWAGKRLCGEVGEGGAYEVDGPSSGHADPTQSEWFAACSGPAATSYPYGETYEPGRCNDDMSGPEQIGEYDGCEGGYPEIFDLSGNLGEWENACTDYNSPDVLQNCLSRGGTWYQGETELRCDAFRDVPRFSMGSGMGFRCCSDPGG